MPYCPEWHNTVLEMRKAIIQYPFPPWKPLTTMIAFPGAIQTQTNKIFQIYCNFCQPNWKQQNSINLTLINITHTSLQSFITRPAECWASKMGLLWNKGSVQGVFAKVLIYAKSVMLMLILFPRCTSKRLWAMLFALCLLCNWTFWTFLLLWLSSNFNYNDELDIVYNSITIMAYEHNIVSIIITMMDYVEFK